MEHSTLRYVDATPASSHSVLNDSGYVTSTPSPLYCNSGEKDQKVISDHSSRWYELNVSETPISFNQKQSKRNYARKYLLKENSNNICKNQENVITPEWQQTEAKYDLPRVPEICENNSFSTVLSDEYNLSLVDPFNSLHVEETEIISDKSDLEYSNYVSNTSGLNDSNFSITGFSPLHGLKNKSSTPLESVTFKKLKTEDSLCILPRKYQAEASTASRPQPSLIGFQKLDFLFQLGDARCCPGVISQILSFLSPQDLVNVCKVSGSWRRICVADPVANRRRLSHVRNVQCSKENLSWNEFKQTEIIPSGLHKGVFREIQNVNRKASASSTPCIPRSPPVSPSKIRFHLFLKAGGGLEEGTRLVPCPRCTRPSRAEQDTARCQALGCQFSFCLLCLCEIHEGRVCANKSAGPARRKTSCVGSKESRRNLRRLL